VTQGLREMAVPRSLAHQQHRSECSDVLLLHRVRLDDVTLGEVAEV
jgi:hypothetical protein